MDPNVYLRASLQVLAIHLSYFKVLNPLIRVTTGSRRVTRIIDAMHNMLPSSQRALRLFGVIVSSLRFYIKHQRHFRRFKGKIWR